MRKSKKDKRENATNLQMEGEMRYREKISDVLLKIKDEKLLKRIYDYVEYLYIYK